MAGPFLMIPALKNCAIVAGFSIIGYVLWLLLVQHWIPAHLRSKGLEKSLDKHDQQSLQVDEEGACDAEEDDVHSEVHHFSIDTVPNRDLSPGLALLEQYSVFGVPSGSWSTHKV